MSFKLTPFVPNGLSMSSEKACKKIKREKNSAHFRGPPTKCARTYIASLLILDDANRISAK